MLARRTASAAASRRSTASLSQFHTSANFFGEGERIPTPIPPTAQSLEREAKMKEYIARQEAQLPYTGEWQPQAAQYSGIAQRQPRPGTQQRQPMQFPRLAGGVQPEIMQREPQMMRGPTGMWPQGYQPQMPRQPPQQQQNSQQQNDQQQVGIYRRRFGQEQYLQQQRQREPGSPVVVRKRWNEYSQQPPKQQPFQQQSTMRGQMPIGQQTARQPEQQQFHQSPPMGWQMPMGQQTARQPEQQQFHQSPPMGWQMPNGQQTARQPEQQQFHQSPPMGWQMPNGQQTARQPEQQQSHQSPPMGQQMPMGQQGRQPIPQVQPGGFRLHKYLTSSQPQLPLHLKQQQFQQQQPQQQGQPFNSNPETSAWAEAVATMEPISPRPLKIVRTRVDNSTQSRPQEFDTPQQYHTPAIQQQQQPQQPQISISDAPPTRESGSFSFNSSPATNTPTGLPGPRAIRRAGITRPRAEDWNKPRPATPASPPRKRTGDRQSTKDSKALRDHPQLRPVAYTPLPPTPESLFPDIPSTLLSPLGQSKILTEALPTFHKPQATWTPEDWEKYDARRQTVKQKWLDGRRYEWDWAGEGGVDGVQNGGQALDSVRRLVSLNPSYDVKGKRVIMGMLWDRLPHPLIEPPRKVLMLQEGGR